MDGFGLIGTGGFEGFRRLFPGVEGQIYLDVAARGLISTPVRAAVDAHMDRRMSGGDKQEMFAAVERVRSLFAQLVGADADEVALVKNISDGVNAIASAVDWGSGDAVVICTDLEHPANLLPWYNLARQKGVRIETIPAAADGTMPVEAMAAAVKPGVRIVAVSTVSFSPGFKTRLAPLAKACRPAGALLLVDAAQSVGIVQTDVRSLGIDVLATSTQKGLLGLYGMGCLFVRRDLADAIAPVYLSRMSVVLEAEHEAASGGIEDYRYAAGARRFDVGNYNYIAAAAAASALDGLLALGPSETEAYVFGLASRLRAGFAQLGLPVFRSANGESEAHIVAVGEGLADVHDQTGSDRMRSLHQHFLDKSVQHSIRRGVLRFSLHAYNDASDVDRTLALADDWNS